MSKYLTQAPVAIETPQDVGPSYDVYERFYRPPTHAAYSNGYRMSPFQKHEYDQDFAGCGCGNRGMGGCGCSDGGVGCGCGGDGAGCGCDSGGTGCGCGMGDSSTSTKDLLLSGALVVGFAALVYYGAIKK